MRPIAFILILFPSIVFSQSDTTVKVLPLNKKSTQYCCINSVLNNVIESDTVFSWDSFEEKEFSEFYKDELHRVLDKIRLESKGQTPFSGFKCVNLAIITFDKISREKGTNIALYEFIFTNKAKSQKVFDQISKTNLTVLNWDDGYTLVKFYLKSNTVLMVLDYSDPDDDEATKNRFLGVTEYLNSIMRE